jgi:HK97 family phage portal protein
MSLIRRSEQRKVFYPNWRPVGGGAYGGTYDAFHSKAAPSKLELVRAFDDLVYNCIRLIVNKILAVNIRLFVKTFPNQPQPKCERTPVVGKALQYLRSTKAMSPLVQIDEVLQHPALDLLYQANPYHNFHDLIALIQTYLELTGNAYLLVKFDPVGLPVSLFPLPSHLVEPVRSEDGFIISYKVGAGTEVKEYSADEVLHFKTINPLDPYGEGTSPVRAVWQRIQISWKELGYLDSTLSNNARPDCLLSPKDPIGSYEAERLAKEYSQRFRGQGSGGVMVVDSSFDVKPLNYTPKDLSELQLYQVLKTTLCNAFTIPPDIFELGTSSNRSTKEAALYSLAEDCIKPRVCLLVGKLNDGLLRLFDKGQGRLFYEATHVIPEDKQFELTKDQTLAASGAITRDEFRQSWGKPSADWASVPLLPPGAVPAYATDPEADSEPVEDLTQNRAGFGSAILALQQAVYSGALPREAAVAALVATYSYSQAEAAALVPAVEVDKPEAQQGPAAAGDQTGAEPVTEEQAPAAASNDLRATVGGSVAIADLQRSYYRGELPREAAVANAQLIFGFTEEEAATLFPELAPNAPQAAQAPASAPEAQSPPEAPAAAPEAAQGPAKALKVKALEVPDIRQAADWDCGPAAVMAVATFFKVGPTEEADYIDALGTTPEDGTSPEAIVEVLRQLGLQTVARDDLTVDDLSGFVGAGSPVIVCVQDYEEAPADIAHESAGHYVIVCDVQDNGTEVTLTLQDPSAGPVAMSATDFLARWQDRGASGEYVHYGIACNKSRPGKRFTKAVTKKSAKPLEKALRSYFGKQAAHVLGKFKAVSKALPASDWFDLHKWTEAMYEEMRPIVALYYDYSARQAAARIGGSKDLYHVVQPKLREGVDKATLLFCQSTNESTSLELTQALSRLREELAEGLEEGAVKQHMADRVKQVFDYAGNERAFQIAVTEASRAQHAAVQITAEESGVAAKKRWILSDDSCPECAPLAGKVVDLGDDFTTRGEGPYSTIPYPPLHPNCRCDMVEVVEGVND